MKYSPWACTLFVLWSLSGFIRANAATVAVCDEASLRAAIAAGGTVTFQCDGTITLANTISVNANVFLDATGRSVVISGGNAVRLFEVSEGVTFALRNLSLRNGFARGTNGAPNQPGGPGQGAAIYNRGVLVATDCAFVENVSLGGSGGIGLDAAPTQRTAGDGGMGQGGAIFNSNGQVLATNCVFASNRALGGIANSNVVSQQIVGKGGSGSGGALGTHGGAVVLMGCSFSNNVASAVTNGMPSGQPGGLAFGGAISVDAGILRAIDTRFAANLSQGSEGAAGSAVGPAGNGGSAYGGTLYTTNGQFFATNCVISLSGAFGGKGGYGSGTSPSASGGNASGGAFYFSAGSVDLVDAMITANAAVPGSSTRFGLTNYGSGRALAGALFNDGATVHIVGAKVLGNSAVTLTREAAAGGAVYQASGMLNVKRSLFATNSAIGGLGAPTALGPPNFPGGPGQGGALFIASGVSDLEACAFVANDAAGGRQPSLGNGGDGFGGAIYNGGRLSATNCTMVANVARGGSTAGGGFGSLSGGSGLGGAIYNAGGTSLLSHITVATNAATAGAGGTNGVGNGGGIYSANGLTRLSASILAYNAPSNCFGMAIADDGFNISSDGSCPFSAVGSRTGVDPRLGPVGDYGGNTLTMPLLEASPAIDGATGSVCPAMDQRGRLRPFGAACDIGAFESSAPYTIRGRITGHFVSSGIGVSLGTRTSATDASMAYRFDDVASGNHSVVPSTVTYLVVPSSLSLSVGPDIVGADFTAYRWNSLNIDQVSPGTVRLRYAGTNSQSVRLQASPDLINWNNWATNTVGTDGLTDFSDQITGNTRLFFRTLIP